MNKNELLRRLPKIDEVLKEGSLVVLSEEKGSLLVTEAVRGVIADMRKNILDIDEERLAVLDSAADGALHGSNESKSALASFFSQFEPANVAARAAARLAEDESLNLYPVVNATGTILHTNLGRAPLCADAVENVAKVSRSYSDLEYNVAKGARGSRHDLVGNLIAELTGAEDAMVVNNNAAATMIVLASMGAGKEIIVSRSELVEIGGAFRIPDIMSQSGAFLQEVGTSNKTKPSDYEKAICKAAGYNRRRAMRIARDFDIEGTLPVVNYKRPLKEAVYALLPPEFKSLRESYSPIALARGLMPKTVKTYKAVASAFLLYMTNLGRNCFQEITEDDVQAYLTQGKIGGDQCRYIKSVLQDCRPVLAGSELERIIRILPMIPRCQKVCDFLTDSEVKALRDVIMSEDKLSLRNRSSRATL